MPSTPLDKSTCDIRYGFDTINKGSGEREITAVMLVRVLKGQTKDAYSATDADSSVNTMATESMSIVQDKDKLYPEFVIWFEGVKDYRYKLPPSDQF